MNLKKVEAYINVSARPVDKALYFVQTGKQTNENLISTLKAYQNMDGGFGNGIEPDLRAPVSTPVSTSVALQYIVKAKVADKDLINQIVKYLLDTYDDAFKGWFRINKEVDQYPHAPWWTFDEQKQFSNWPNPTVEIVSYLNQFQNYTHDHQFLEGLNTTVQDYLLKNTVDEPHDLLCYKRYFESFPDHFSDQAKKKLFEAVSNVVETDSSKWNNYVPKPFDFVNSPHSAFISIFDPKLIEKNIEFLVSSLQEDHWEPTWSWGDETEAWRLAKNEWSGYITVQNALLLREFNVREWS
jgi:hypothetical protein